MRDAAYVRSGAPLTRQVDGEVVMFHPARGEYFALGQVGSRIWELLEQPTSMDGVCSSLRREFDVDEATCVAQVSAFLAELSAAELVERGVLTRSARLRDLPARVVRNGPLALEAGAALVAASIAVRFMPSARVTRLLGESVQGLEPGPGSNPGLARAGRRVGWAVERVAGLLPWHPVCLPQAIATRWMLTRRGIACESHLGITGVKPLSAHAWVTVSDVVVQGGSVAQVTELGAFR